MTDQKNTFGLLAPVVKKGDVDDDDITNDFMLELGDGKKYLISNKMAEQHPYLKDPECRFTAYFEDIYLLLCGYSIQHLSKELFNDKARLAIFRTNCLDFNIVLNEDTILLVQKDEFDELQRISDYVRGKGSNKYASFSTRRETRSFLAELRDSFSDLFETISPDHILDLLESGDVKKLVVKNWSTKSENSILLFVKRFVDKFFRE